MEVVTETVVRAGTAVATPEAGIAVARLAAAQEAATAEATGILIAAGVAVGLELLAAEVETEIVAAMGVAEAEAAEEAMPATREMLAATGATAAMATAMAAATGTVVAGAAVAQEAAMATAAAQATPTLGGLVAE
jgi:hypothetical protein